MVKRGDQAPDFERTTSDGQVFRLAAERGKNNVVLFFYPGDFTPVCTKEACGFRDMFAELEAKDTRIIGVSTDSDASHEKFAAAYKLGYPLISDVDKSLAKAYGATSVLTTLMGSVSRTTYVIDKTGRVTAVLKGEVSAAAHLDGVRRALAELPP